MKSITKYTGIAAAVVLALNQHLQAVPITGNITFSGSVQLDAGSVGTATEVTSWINPISVGGGSGSLVGAGTTGIFSDANWSFNTSTPINNFWVVGGFSFELLSSWILSQYTDAFGLGPLQIEGTGVISANGYTPTPYVWTFSIDDPNSGSDPATWTFRASDSPIPTGSGGDSPVPDGGATVILLGVALSGIALLKKKLTA